MAEQFANNAVGNLNAGITNVAASLVLQAGQGSLFPASGTFRIVIGTEIITVGARSGDTLSSLGRGAESTAAVAHNAGDVVTHEVTAGALGAFLQAGVLLGVRVFLASATYTPTTGTSRVYIECVGGGGGGGGAAATGAAQGAFGSGGGAGAYAASFLTTGFSGIAYTIGAAGTGGAAGTNNGVDGGDTIFGASVIVAKGGIKGTGAAVAGAATICAPGGAGGLATSCVGDFLASGQPGGHSLAVAAGAGHAGFGGMSVLGGGGLGSALAGAASVAGAAGFKGGGGGGGAVGASSAAAAGGAGGSGVIRIWEYA